MGDNVRTNINHLGIKPTPRSTQPSIPLGVGKLSTDLHELRRGAFTLVEWQVTLRDFTWQVTLRSFDTCFL